MGFRVYNGGDVTTGHKSGTIPLLDNNSCILILGEISVFLAESSLECFSEGKLFNGKRVIFRIKDGGFPQIFQFFISSNSDNVGPANVLFVGL